MNVLGGGGCNSNSTKTVQLTPCDIDEYDGISHLYFYTLFGGFKEAKLIFCPCFLICLPSLATSSSLLEVLHSCLTAAHGGPVPSVLMSGVARRGWSRAQKHLLVHLMGSIGDLYTLKGSSFISSMRCKCERPVQPQACAHQGFKLSFPLQ